MLEAVATLTADSDPADEGLDVPEWNVDPDGIFRNIARPIYGWDFHKRRQLQQLTSWPSVERAFDADERLSRQVNTFVGTALGGGQIGIYGLAMHVLPRPSEIDRTSEVFEQRYTELETYLVAHELEFKTIWPVPGLIVADMPIELESGVVLDAMSDRELVIALRTEIVRPHFPSETVFLAEPASRTCIRYRYRLPKLIGPRGDDTSTQFQELDQRLRGIRATIEESLALVVPEPLMTAGQFGISGEQWSPQSGRIDFQQSMMPRHVRWRRVAVDAQRVLELQEVWKQVSQRGLLAGQKGLALALRRLSYQAQRERPEDELLDIMIAAEALYLIGLGNESDRGELRYRLALRAAVWADEHELGMVKSEVIKLMQSAYDTRSRLAHGASPEPKNMIIKGQRVELPELVNVTRTVVAQGSRKALAAAASSENRWPPDWDILILRPQPTALSKAYDLTTEDDLSTLAKRVLDHSPQLNAGVNRATNRLSKKAPQFMTLSTLRALMRTFAGSDKVEETELEGLAVTAAEFFELLAHIRPELNVETSQAQREETLASDAVILHGYAFLMKDYNNDLAKFGRDRAGNRWAERLARLSPDHIYRGGNGFEGDYLSKQNPLWQELGITRYDPSRGRITVAKSGRAKARAGRELRRYLQTYIDDSDE
jgi:hypothetical protein